MKYSWSDLPRLCGLALAYALLARLVLGFFSANGVVSILWPASGLALAALLAGGRKYWPAVFIGATAGNMLAGNALWISITLASGNTLEVLTALWLLGLPGDFDAQLTRLRDFIWLGFAAVVSACINAVIGIAILWQSGLLTLPTALLELHSMWQEDALGMILFAPLLLVWRQLPRGWFGRARVLETIACFGLSFVAGQIIFMGWFGDVLAVQAKAFWMFAFITWAALRFGRHGVLLVLLMTLLQALASASSGLGYFADDIQQSGLLNLWLFMFVLTLVGMVLAFVRMGRKQAEVSLTHSTDLLDKLSQHVPGVIYQFQLFPDGRSCFPFASEAIQDIYEVTPEQVREDASAVFALLHPDDYDDLVASIKKSAETLTTWRHEFRVVLPKQGVCWRAGESHPEKLADGSVLWHGFISDINERKRDEEERNKLTSILEQSLNEIYLFDAQTLLFEYVNEGGRRNLGYSMDDLRSMTPLQIKTEFDDSSLRQLLDPLLRREQEKLTFETVHRRADGTLYPVEGHLQLISIMSRPMFVAIVLDITERRKAGEQILRLTHLYKALSEVNEAIVRMEKQEELFPLVCRCAVDFGGMELAWIGQLDKSGEMLVPVASHGKALGYLEGIEISASADVEAGRGPAGTAFRENRSMIVNDYMGDPRTLPWQKRATGFGLNSGAAFPILRAGKPFAVFSVYHMQANAMDDQVIALLEEMTKDISFALDNFDRETARQSNEESLRLAASVYETSSEAMTVTDADGIILTVNPAFTKITGYTLEDVVGRNSSMLGSGRHDKTFYQALWQEIVTTGHWHGEIWDKRKSGEEYAIWLTINTIFNKDGTPHRRVSLFSDITEWKNTQELVWKQANFDPLSGLPNRQMFHDRMDQEIKKSHRAGLPMALLFLDIDHFKEINDTLGHDMGDVLLKEAAQRLTSCVRETDTVARLGGDEFTIILSEITDPNIVERISQNILKKLADPFQLGSETAYVSGSIGITVYPEDAVTADALLKNADQAMYEAKNQGRNRYHYFTQSMQQAAQARLRLMNDLRKALEAHQFRVYYQPIVDLGTGLIHKAEALIRWQHPKRGLIGPVEFITLAEESGLIIDIGEWVFQQAAQQVGLWRKAHHPEFQISVNRSPVQFHNEGKTHPSWTLHLDSINLPGQSIVVEITEGLLLDTGTGVIDRLQEFREGGIQLSLDDFGTGYSSLSYLNKFDIDYLKIDQSFVRNLSPGSSNMALCEAIIVMAHKLGMKVIAEGIETEQQRDLLAQAGCDYGQGYLFSRPLPAEQFEVILIKHNAEQEPSSSSH